MAADDEKPRRGRAWQILRILISIGLAAGILVYVLNSGSEFSDVWSEIGGMTGAELATLGVVAIWNLFSYWLVMVSATPGLTFPQAMVLTQSSTAVANSIPGGAAVAIGLTYAMLSSWGFSKSRSTLSVLVSGLWNSYAKLAVPVLALALLALQGNASAGRVTAGLIGIAALVGSVAVFALVLRREDFARRVGDTAARWMSRVRRTFGRAPVTGWGGACAKFRARTIGLVRHAWLRLTIATLVSHFSLYLVLLIALRHIGVSNSEVSWTEVLAVFAFVRLITAIPITPGGLGVVELALIAGLTTAGGDRPEVVAAVLIYRFLTYVVPIPLGLVTYLFWRRNTSWRNSAPPLSPSLAPVTATPT